MTVLFNSSLCAFISFINFLNACFFFPVDLIMHPPHVNVLFEGALYISHLKWIKENACFWLILIELSVQVSYIYTAIECMQITETNWWKKIYQLSFRTPLDVLKMLNSRGGANSLSSFFLYLCILYHQFKQIICLHIFCENACTLRLTLKSLLLYCFISSRSNQLITLANMCFVNVHLVYSF